MPRFFNRQPEPQSIEVAIADLEDQAEQIIARMNAQTEQKIKEAEERIGHQIARAQNEGMRQIYERSLEQLIVSLRELNATGVQAIRQTLEESIAALRNEPRL
jgi:hypothetical protein